MQNDAGEEYRKQEELNQAVSSVMRTTGKIVITIWEAIRQVFYEVFKINLP